MYAQSRGNGPARGSAAGTAAVTGEQEIVPQKGSAASRQQFLVLLCTAESAHAMLIIVLGVIVYLISQASTVVILTTLLPSVGRAVVYCPSMSINVHCCPTIMECVVILTTLLCFHYCVVIMTTYSHHTTRSYPY